MYIYSTVLYCTILLIGTRHSKHYITALPLCMYSTVLYYIMTLRKLLYNILISLSDIILYECKANSAEHYNSE